MRGGHAGSARCCRRRRRANRQIEHRRRRLRRALPRAAADGDRDLAVVVIAVAVGGGGGGERGCEALGEKLDQFGARADGGDPHLGEAVAEGGRELALPKVAAGVHGGEEPEGRRRLHLLERRASLGEHERARRIEHRVQPLEHRIFGEGNLVDEQQISRAHRHEERAVDPLEELAARGGAAPQRRRVIDHHLVRRLAAAARRRRRGGDRVEGSVDSALERRHRHALAAAVVAVGGGAVAVGVGRRRHRRAVGERGGGGGGAALEGFDTSEKPWRAASRGRARRRPPMKSAVSVCWWQLIMWSVCPTACAYSSHTVVFRPRLADEEHGLVVLAAV